VLVVLLLGPGVLLQPLLGSGKRAVELPLYAAAAWVVAFWWLRLLPLEWTAPVIALGAASLVGGLFFWRRPPDPGSALVWIAGVALLTVLARSALVAPGVDGAMHTGIARVLADAGGHPATFRPMWPVDVFRAYPVGQPTTTALIARLGGLGWREAGLVGHALSYALVLVGFAAAVSRWNGGAAAGLAVGVAAVLAARSPLYFWTWGGAPNALGIAFALPAFAAAADVLRSKSWRDAAACALFSAGALLTHPVSVIALGWAGLPILGGALLLRPELRRGFPALLAAGAAASLLCAPYLAGLRAALPPEGVAWARAFLRETGTLGTVPRMLHDAPLVLGAAAAVFVLAARPWRAAVPLALAAALALLVLNGRVAALPFSVLLYPDRIAVLLLFPIALLAAEALAGRPRIAAVAAAALAVHAALLQGKMLGAGREHALATEADLRVLSSSALPSGCWVANNYGDAGQWIPALLGRPITVPQVNVAFFDLSLDVHPCAAYRGDKRVYHLDALPCPGRACESVARDGGAELFRIVDPDLAVRVVAPR